MNYNKTILYLLLSLIKYFLIFNPKQNLKMKKILMFFLVLLPFISVAQHLNVIEVDTSNYPMMSAKFIALDKKLNFVNDIKKEECSIIENEISQKIIKVVNQAGEPEMQSVVIIVDVSGSMGGTNLNLAKDAIIEFISLTPFSTTELAIITFNSNVFVNQDFTRNKGKLINAVQGIQASGGTDYNIAMFGSNNSALNLTQKRAEAEPTIIFLTDGLSSANYQNISALANSQKAKIYSITLNMPMPHDLAEITALTDADYFENISTTEEAKLAYLSILSKTFNFYSEIFWESERSCDELIDYTFTARQNYKSEDYYQIYPSLTKGIYFEKQVVAFDPNISQNKMEIKIGAHNPATITNINIKDTSSFDIKYNFKLPIKIVPGKLLKVTVIKKDGAKQQSTTNVSVDTDVCKPKKFYIFNGNIANFIVPGSLIVRNPNGGEEFYSGEITSIKWINKTPNKLVNIYVSSDNGKHYTWIKRTSRTKLSWLIPGMPSDSCLIKVALQSSPILINRVIGSTKQIAITGSGEAYYSIKAKKIELRSSSTGALLDEARIKSNSYIKNFKLLQNTNQIVINSGNKLFIYDKNAKRKKLRKLKHKKEKIENYYFSPNGNKIIVFYKKKNSFYEFDGTTGKKRAKHKVGYTIKKASYGSNIASIITKDKHWIIWDLTQKKAIFEMQTKTGFSLTDISYNGDYAVVLDNEDNLIYWSQAKGDTILKVPMTMKPTEIKFNPKNNSLLCNEKEKNIIVYNGPSILFSYQPPRKVDVSTIGFTPLGNELFYSVSEGSGRDKIYSIKKFDLFTQVMTDSKNDISFDSEVTNILLNNTGNVGIFKTSNYYETWLLPNAKNAANDVSDNVFSIETLVSEIKDTIFMPDIFTESNFAFLDTSVFYNPNAHSAIIDKIYFEGKHQHKFGMVSGIPPLGVNAKSHKGVEFSFKGAHSTGFFTSNIKAISGLDTLNSVIKIRTIKPPVRYITKKLNLGSVKITKKLNKSIELFENITDSTFVVDSIVNWGPDKTQINITNNLKNKKIASGEKIKFDFEFHGTNRGATNAVFFIYINGMPKPLKLITSGTVLAPYKITIKCEVINELDNSPLKIEVLYYNSENNKYINKFNTNSQGEAKLKLPNELSYRFDVKGTTSSDSKIVDLTNVFSDTIITVKLQVINFEDGMKYALKNGKFAVKSSTLNTETKQELNKLITLMKQSPEISIQIDGHTDNEGTTEVNTKLSEQRAKSVKKYLVSKGISATRINTIGYGATKPLNTNDTEEGKSENRRIEITINVKK